MRISISKKVEVETYTTETELVVYKETKEFMRVSLKERPPRTRKEFQEWAAKQITYNLERGLGLTMDPMMVLGRDQDLEELIWEGVF